MSDTMTATQLSDLRFDLADIESAFSDVELNRCWARLSGARDDRSRFEATKGLAIRSLLHDAAKFNDYTAGQTDEKKSQVFEHYLKLFNSMYAAVVQDALGGSGQVARGSWRMQPHQERTAPDEVQPPYVRKEPGDA